VLDRTVIESLIPHKGAMCLLDGVCAWSRHAITAFSRTHLDDTNPLRRGGVLSVIAGCEYAFQAAALHGALMDGGTPQPPGRVVKLALDRITSGRLDDPELGILAITAELEHAGLSGLVYRFGVAGEQGRPLLSGRGVIALLGRAA
jgi:predicted hotdog family 3-hydroxylacyl-ACP dehydratase